MCWSRSGPGLDRAQSVIDHPWWSQSWSQKLGQGLDCPVSGLAKMAPDWTRPNFPNTRWQWHVEGGGGAVARDGAVHAMGQCTRQGGVWVACRGTGGKMQRWWHKRGWQQWCAEGSGGTVAHNRVCTQQGVHTTGQGVNNLRWVREDVGLHHIPDSFLNVIIPETWGQQ